MEISGIVIEIQGKKYAVDMDKARELYLSLHELFGEKGTTYVPYPSQLGYIGRLVDFNNHTGYPVYTTACSDGTTNYFEIDLNLTETFDE